MRDELRLTIRNDLADLARASQRADEMLERHALAERDVYATQLALEEVLSNVIRHAYVDRERHDIALTLRVADGGIELEVEDDGRAFDPLDASEPDLHVPLEQRRAGGLGIHLLRRFAREMRYERDRDKNRLWLRI